MLSGVSPHDLGLKGYLHELRRAVTAGDEGKSNTVTEASLRARVKLRKSSIVIDALELWWDATVYSIEK